MYHRNCDYFIDRKWPDHGLIIYCYWVIVSTDYMSSFCVLAPKAVCQYDTRIVMSASNRFLALTKQAEHCITLWTGCALWCVWLRSESSTALLMYRVCFETRVVAVGAEHCITYVQDVLCDTWDCFTCVIHYTCKFLFFVFWDDISYLIYECCLLFLIAKQDILSRYILSFSEWKCTRLC